LLLAAALPFAALQPPAAHAGDIDHDKTIVGSWVVEIRQDSQGTPLFNLATFTRDGGSLNSDPDLGGGHGVWKQVGRKTYETKFLTLSPATSFAAGTVVTVTGTLTMDQSGDELTGPFKVRFTQGPGGPEIPPELAGRVVLTRIRMDD
jgi:hypothetical protein